MTIKDYWRYMKGINSFLPYFPPDITTYTVLLILPTLILGNDLKNILDRNLPQSFKEICRKNQYNVLNPIGDTLNYIHNVESRCAENSKMAKAKAKGSKPKDPKPKEIKAQGNQSQINVHIAQNKTTIQYTSKEGDFFYCRYLTWGNECITPVATVIVTSAPTIKSHPMAL